MNLFDRILDARTLAQRLKEYTINQMGVSGITWGAMEKYGLGNYFLVNASEDAQSNGKLSLMFAVQSSKNDNKHVDLRGHPQPFLTREYNVRLTFENIYRIVPKDWKQQGLMKAKQFISQIFKNCDVKVACDCPAFYWQGMHEGDDKAKTAYFNFVGTHGTGKWNARHAATGGKIGQQMCKHIWNVAHELGKSIPDIVSKLGIHYHQ